MKPKKGKGVIARDSLGNPDMIVVTCECGKQNHITPLGLKSGWFECWNCRRQLTPKQEKS